MSDVTLKFQCKVADLVNAMEKYGSVQNVVIENGNDAKGIINCLIGIIGDDTYYGVEKIHVPTGLTELIATLKEK